MFQATYLLISNKLTIRFHYRHTNHTTSGWSVFSFRLTTLRFAVIEFTIFWFTTTFGFMFWLFWHCWFLFSQNKFEYAKTSKSKWKKKKKAFLNFDRENSKVQNTRSNKARKDVFKFSHIRNKTAHEIASNINRYRIDKYQSCPSWNRLVCKSHHPLQQTSKCSLNSKTSLVSQKRTKLSNSTTLLCFYKICNSTQYNSWQ